MKAITLQQAANLSGGRIIQGRPDHRVEAVNTDTRTLTAGALYVALVGERFDGHAFLTKAAGAGASAVMVSHPPERGALAGDLGVIQVDDTLVGLQELARGYRQGLPTKAVVITGSNGKTSTKDMIRGVLSSRYSVTATLGNLNNHIGLPLTILNTGGDDAYGIWEIGMNHPGEIAPLAAIAAPDLAVITNIGTAHIGNMGSREAIAQEKGMLAEALSESGVLVLNADDDFTPALRKRTAARVITAGIDAGEIRATLLEGEGDGVDFELTMGEESRRVRLPIPGRHMVSNALLAAAVGRECGLTLDEIALALTNTQLTPGRLEVLNHAGIKVINDAYNANPDSMRASLATVGAMKGPGKKFALLGAMGELGSAGAEAHREIGRAAVAEGFDHICSVQERARGITDELAAHKDQELHHFQDHAEAAEFLTRNAKPGDVVLLKGSRAAAMDTVYKLFAAKSL